MMRVNDTVIANGMNIFMRYPRSVRLAQHGVEKDVIQLVYAKVNN